MKIKDGESAKLSVSHDKIVVKIALDQIELGDRLRYPHPDDVRGIEISMAERGLLAPISVRLIENNKYRVVYGAHRFLAAQNLRAAGDENWGEIDAFIIECDDYEARMREIDENLRRAELTPYDKATFLAASHRLWVEKHGNVRGGDRKSKTKRFGFDQSEVKPQFFRDTAQRLGIDEETVRLAVKRRAKASDELWERLRGTDITRKGVLLDRLLKAHDPGAIIDMAEAEYGGNIEAALNRKVPKKKTAPSVERVLKIIDEALEIWSDEDRKRFLREMRGRK